MENILKDFHSAGFLLSNPKICCKIKKASAQNEHESCGIATPADLFILENIHENPKTHFLINPVEYFKILHSHNIWFIWHSHVTGDCEPSFEDIFSAKAHAYKSLIYSVEKNKFCFFGVNPYTSVYFSF